MTLIVVERELEKPLTPEELRAMEERVGRNADNVRLLRTFQSLDGKTVTTLYEAPDAEAVKAAQDEAGVPVSAVWAARPLRPSDL